MEYLPLMALSAADAYERLMRAGLHYGRPIEPPKRNVLAAAVMSRSRLSGQFSETPHMSDAPNVELARIEFEYEQRDSFFGWFGGQVQLADLDGLDVLDVGCGWGGKTIYYAEASRLRSIVGFEIDGWDSGPSYAFARERGVDNCTFLNAYAESMPFESGTFDVVVIEDVLEHVDDPAKALDECARVLRPGGRVLARFPSIKMMHAHHFDRVTILPGIHRIMPMRAWVAGFNYEIAARDLHMVPFARVERRFDREVCGDLSGMDFDDFSRIAEASEFSIERLEMEPVPSERDSALWRCVVLPAYGKARNVRALRELLSASISFVGRRP